MISRRNFLQGLGAALVSAVVPKGKVDPETPEPFELPDCQFDIQLHYEHCQSADEVYVYDGERAWVPEFEGFSDVVNTGYIDDVPCRFLDALQDVVEKVERQTEVLPMIRADLWYTHDMGETWHLIDNVEWK